MDEQSRKALGAFLRARRAELSPESVGLPPGSRRRVLGLRREEVAEMAAMSTDYYSRLEQGRIRASGTVVEALERVLRLDPSQRAYLRKLAAPRGLDPVGAVEHPPPQPQLQRLLDDFRYTPAFVIGPRTEIVAWNYLARALIADFSILPAADRYYVRLLFEDAAMFDLYADWEGVARLSIAQMRMHNTHNPGDEELARLVDNLSDAFPDFRSWWAEHDVSSRDAGAKHLRHPIVGDLFLNWSAMTWAADPSLQIIAWSAEPGSVTHERLIRLAALVDDPGDSQSSDE